MNRRNKLYAIAFVACASIVAPAAHAEANKVVIGDIDDMSGVYADIIGSGGVEAAKMAIADFGGSVLGKKIELLALLWQILAIDRRNWIPKSVFQ